MEYAIALSILLLVVNLIMIYNKLHYMSHQLFDISLFMQKIAEHYAKLNNIKDPE